MPRTVLITGTEGFIGTALLKRFAESRATVVSVDVAQPKRDLLANESFHQVDLSDVTAIEQLWKDLAAAGQSIDIVVNNAGLGGQRQPLHEYDMAGYNAIMDVNVRAPFVMMQKAIAQSTGRLSIINLASTAGHRASKLAAPYCISKAAVLAMTRSAAAEYSHMGIRVNSVSPGALERPNIQGFSAEEVEGLKSKVPQGRLAKAKEVADMVFFLASDEAQYVTGQDLIVDGGMLI